MKQENNIYRDSRNYAPIDVAKGMDLRTKKIVLADETDPNFELLPKCKNCVNFKPDSEKIETGTCEASMNDPKFTAYPDMVAVTCDMYKEKK